LILPGGVDDGSGGLEAALVDHVDVADYRFLCT
jgi:hypothetical protein